jgi:flagellar hook-basal body complex protein FliE
MDVTGIENLSQAAVKTGGTVKQKNPGTFGEVIEKAINKVNTLEHEANSSIVDLLHGKADIHETMLALQKSDISMRLLLTVRGKVIEAYREIMHMQF